MSGDLGMLGQDRFKALGFSCLLLAITGCTNTQVGTIAITPATQSLTTGQTSQLTATGTIGHGSHPAGSQNVTDQVTWASSTPQVVTVTSPGGLATAVGPGTTTISAAMPGAPTATATITVAGASAAESLLSIAVLPSSITDNDLLGTGQFLAYGTFSTAPTVMDITNGYTRNGVYTPVTWISGSQTIFPIDSAGAPGATGGLVTAVGSGTADIYAVAANPDGTVVYSPSSTFNCPYVAYTPATATAQAVLGSCNEETIAPGLLVTLTVFNAGLNTTNWLITAPSATGTPDVIRCGGSAEASQEGGSVCTATYPLTTNGLPTTITLTAPAEPGVSFGGWSWNCTSTSVVTAAGPNTCTVTLGSSFSSNESVGAIFN
jgi:Big-like domain-containing protein